MGVGLSPPAATTWRVVGASVCGTRHEADGMGCQDAFAVAALPDGGLVVAVADGAGSAPMAAIGASVAVGAAVDPLPSGDPQLAAVGAVERARLAVLIAAAEEAAARGEAVPLDHFATTLAVVVATRGVVAAAQVGDGAVVVQHGDGVAELLVPSDRGEYLNETTFLTSPGWRGAVRTVQASADDLLGLAAMTDGIELLAVDLATGSPHDPFFAPLWTWASSDGASDDAVREFLASERVCQRTDDDKTLVLAVRAATGA